MHPRFVTDYKAIVEQVNLVDAVQYGQTRNYTDGAVTYLSPYISRGVISTRQVLKNVLDRGYKIPQIASFVQELCWRDYFQRVAQVKDVNRDIKQAQTSVANDEIPSPVLTATTGIEGIDNSIRQLYQVGYMHNHCRMYTASLVCNIARSHWYLPAQWMYYHLLDGDWASNACSWQWVAGANSSKKYFANQQNINKYTHTDQSGTYLDKTYEELEDMEVPARLSNTQKFNAATDLPLHPAIQINPGLPIFLYNYYNLDPLWHKDEPGNRVLLLDPAFFAQYPVSKQCIDFMLALSSNIPGIQVYVGSFASLCDNYPAGNIYYKEHPLNRGYTGIEESRDWISENVKGYYPSFFAYWKHVEKDLRKTYQTT
jgi:deoxyribodipyrimidine photo-lyase